MIAGMQKFLRIAALGIWGVAGTAAVAAEAPAEALVRRGEAWLSEGTDLGLEMAHVIAAGKKGNRRQARSDLELIATEAESRGLKLVWLQAQQWWVRFTLADHTEADLTPALEDLLKESQAAGLRGEEAEVYALWGEVMVAQGQWLMAVKAQDRTTQLALDEGAVPRALEAFLEMARLCRRADHGWRLRQVWVRIDQVIADRPVVLTGELEAALKTERAAGALLLARMGPVGGAITGVDLQPRDGRVVVSAPDRELGRSRFLLTNASAFATEGELAIRADHAAVTAWQGSSSGLFVTLGKGTAVQGARHLRLLPGQQLEVYVEHEPGLAQDTVQVAWEGGAKSATATGTFYFSDGLPAVSVVNAGVFQLNAGWSIPLYHEIYQRTGRARVQNLQVTASAPCHLEIYDHDTGRLIAVDGNGDGNYRASGDLVVDDADGDGWPDLVVGDRARAIEIYAWPAGSPGQAITVSAGLRPVEGGPAGNGSAENTVSLRAGEGRP